MADDPLSTHRGTAEQSGGRETRAANLFDLRRIIGGVFVRLRAPAGDPRAVRQRRGDREGRRA